MKGVRRITSVVDGKHQDAAVVHSKVPPSSSSFHKQEKAGYLQTYSSKTFLGREKWKQRYYILSGTKLHRFHKKEDSNAISGNPSKCRVINLDLYDICQHVSDSGLRKEHVFILDGANSGNVPPKYVFAAETKEDMQEWIGNLRKALLRSRENRRPQRPPRSKASSALPSSHRKSQQQQQRSDGDEEPLTEPNTPTRLYSVTKYRVKGPKGRRLPQKKSRQYRDGNEKFISSSLCELDVSLSDENLTRPSRLHRASADTPPLRDRAKSSSFGNLAYQYSSSEESLVKERVKRCAKSAEVARIQESGSEEEDEAAKCHEKSKVMPCRPHSNATPESESLLSSPVLKSSSSPDNGSMASPVLATSPRCSGGVRGDKPDLHLAVGESGSEPEASSKQQECEQRNSGGPLIYLSAKLLELSSCLARIRCHTKDDLQAVKEHLADIRRKLFEWPTTVGSPSADAICSQAAVVMMDLKPMEEDVETLITITSRIEKSLQVVINRYNL